jgi:hypothetical protein
MKCSVLLVLFASAFIIKENFCDKSVKENVKSDEKSNENIQIDASTIMILDSKTDHDKLLDKMKFDKFATNEPYHLIYYPEMTRNGIKITAESKYKSINYIQDLNRTHLGFLTFEYFHEN